MMTRILESIIGLTRLDALVARAEGSRRPVGIFTRALDTAALDVVVAPADLARIPLEGPVILVANHPTGFAEGLIVPALLEAVRGDGKALAHDFFSRWPSLAEHMFLVDPQARAGDRSRNANGVSAAARWLRRGGSLAMFPAAEVARPARPFGPPRELPWHRGMAHLVKLSRATVVPVHVSGRSGRLHQFLSSVHPRLGVLALARELTRRRGRTVTVKIGQPMTAERLIDDSPLSEMAARCREAALALESAAPSASPDRPQSTALVFPL